MEQNHCHSRDCIIHFEFFIQFSKSHLYCEGLSALFSKFFSPIEIFGHIRCRFGDLITQESAYILFCSHLVCRTAPKHHLTTHDERHPWICSCSGTHKSQVKALLRAETSPHTHTHRQAAVQHHHWLKLMKNLLTCTQTKTTQHTFTVIELLSWADLKSRYSVEQLSRGCLPVEEVKVLIPQCKNICYK